MREGSMAANTSKHMELWQRAVDSLDPQVLRNLDPTRTGMRDIVNTVLKVAEERHAESLRKRYRIVRRNKPDIIVRDVIDRIVTWIQRFKEIGDVAVQYDPGHAALPWAAVRFVLIAAANYTEVERELFEEMELITRLLAKFREIESIYLARGAQQELQEAVVSTYATMLKALADIVKFLTETKRVRFLRAPIRLTGGENLNKLLSKEREVLRFTNLVDSKRLLITTTKVERTAELSEIADKAVQEEKYVAVLDWLSRTKYLDHHNDQRTLRSPASGTWLLNHTDYISWHSKSSSSTLLVHGIPGCGKTILCSLVVDDGMSPSPGALNKAPVAFFYCSASESEQDRRNTASVLRSLARQLTASGSRHPKIHSAALAMYDGKLAIAKQHGFDLLPPSSSECEALILAALEDNPAMLAVDAIDEMEDPQTLLDSLEVICTKSSNVVKIFITGRDSVSALQMTTPVDRIRITAADNHMDVRQYILDSVEQLVVNRKISQEMRKHVVESLTSRAGETFQWAKLQLSQLRTNKQVIVEQDMPAELTRLATSTLGELYDKIYDLLIGNQGITRHLIIHAFSWLLYSQELLAVDAFLEIVAAAAKWETPSPDGLVDICRGFIYIDTQSNVVRFVHDSVRTYLRTQPLFDPHEAHRLIAHNCLRILKQPPPDELTSLQPTHHPYGYVTLYFGHHLLNMRPTQTDNHFYESVESFHFSGNDTGLYARMWLETANKTFDSVPTTHSQKIAMEVITSEICSPLFPICAFSMLYILQRHVWPKDFDWNQRNKHGHTALYIAAHYGHSSIVSFLLDRHANPNIICGRLGTALQCAAYWGHEDVVQQLLSHGAELSLPGKFPSVLHAACKGNRESVVLMLLQSGYPVSTQTEYDVVFAEVVRAGFAQALLKLRSSPFAQTTSASRDQRLATEIITSGEVNGLRFLLRGSSATDIILPGSLALSALNGHETMTTFLINQGLDIDEHGEMGTPLRCASAYGHNNTCRLLLDRGADVNAHSQFGNALHAASMRGHLHTVRLLLGSGADANAHGGYYGTALQASSYNGHVEVTRALIVATSYSGLCYDAIEAAKDGGHPEIIQVFEDAGYQPSQTLKAVACSFPREIVRHLRDLSPSGDRHSESEMAESFENQKTRLDQRDPLDFGYTSRWQIGSYANGGSRKRSRQSPSSASWFSAISDTSHGEHETSSEHQRDVILDEPPNSRGPLDNDLGSLAALSNRLILDTRQALSILAPQDAHTAFDSQDPVIANHKSDSQHSPNSKLAAVEAKQETWLFNESRSLANNFTIGPGAVAKYYLRRLSQKEAEGKELAVALEMAAAYGQHELVQLLVDHRINVDAAGLYYGTALQAASRYGHSNIVATLLQAGANPNILDGRYETALRAAVIGRNLDVVKLLLESGADAELCSEARPECDDIWCRDESCLESKSQACREIDGPQGTPLYLAICGKHREITHTLIAADANVNSVISDRLAHPLLVRASAWGDPAVVQSLLDAGAQSQVPCHHLGNSSALRAAIHGQHLAVVKMLLARGFDLNAETGEQTTLQSAINRGNLEILDVLLQTTPRCSEKVLCRAIEHEIEVHGFSFFGHSILEHLLDHARDSLSSHAIVDLCTKASRRNNTQIFETLLDDLCRRSDPISESAFAVTDFREFGDKALLALLRYIPITIDIFVEFCIRGDVDMVRRGLSQGCDPRAEDRHGRPALHFAAVRGRAPVVKLLIDNGAIVNDVHSKYGTPLVLALEGCVGEKLPVCLLDDNFVEHTRLELHDDLRYWAVRPFWDLERPSTRGDHLATISHLLPRSAGVYDYASSCGSALSLAAYLGDIELFDNLLTSGASLQATNEGLTSPLLAAVLGKQTGIIARIASITPNGPVDPENRALHLACEICDAPVIRALYTCGYNCNTKASSGQTALNFSLRDLVQKSRYLHIDDGVLSSDTIAAEVPVNTLLELDLNADVSADDLSTAAEIRHGTLLDKIFKKLLTRARLVDFPSEILVKLLRSLGEGVMTTGTAAWQIIEEKRVLTLTNEIMAATCNTQTVVMLLDKYPSYIIDSQSLDHIGKYHDFRIQELEYSRLSEYEYWLQDQRWCPNHRRSSMELLFSRSIEILPTEENVKRALLVARESDTNQDNFHQRLGPHNLIDLMFERNQKLVVTKEMLEVVRACEDLRALMAHVEPGRRVVTAAVLISLVKRAHRSYWDKISDDEISGADAERLLQTFLEFDHEVPLPGEVLHFFMDVKTRGFDILERLLRDDTGLQLSAEYVCSSIKFLKIHRSKDHDNFVQILERYRDRWQSPAEVQQVIDTQYEEELEEKAKQKRGMREDRQRGEERGEGEREVYNKTGI